MKKLLLILVLLALTGLVGLFVIHHEGEDPSVTLDPAGGSVSPSSELSLHVTDQKSGLAAVRVVLRQGDVERTLLSEDFAAAVHTWKETLSLPSKGLADGPVSIIVRATDRSWSNWGKGNTVAVETGLVLDSAPPVVSILSHQHNLNQGGAGAVAFTLSEPASRVAVVLGQWSFPAYEQPSGNYLCIFAFPHSADPGLQPLVLARDLAGNEIKTGFYNHVNARTFKRDSITISPRFLAAKMPQFQNLFPGTSDPLQLFLKVNTELRRQNREALQKIGTTTVPEPLWDGSFQRMKNAAPMAGFADHRTYYHDGQKIDEQTHLGIDLASLAQAAVPAANSGRVVFAGFMGIYGQCVILDHGTGLQTLYAHLSKIDVTEDSQVQKGQTIGNTGATGLAGGDHLHFAVLVSGVPVNPIEWWDATWIKNNVEEKLTLAAGGTVQQ